MNNSFSKINYKDLTFAQESRKPRGAMFGGLVAHSSRRVGVYKPASSMRSSVLYYHPASTSKAMHARLRGSSRKLWTEYPTEELANPLANMLVLGGGEANVIETESSLTQSGLADMRQIGRVLALDHTLETLLFLADHGPTGLATLMEQLVPQDKIVKTISELHRIELVEIKENTISPTHKALKISALLREKLKNTLS